MSFFLCSMSTVGIRTTGGWISTAEVLAFAAVDSKVEPMRVVEDASDDACVADLDVHVFRSPGVLS